MNLRKTTALLALVTSISLYAMDAPEPHAKRPRLEQRFQPESLKKQAITQQIRRVFSAPDKKEAEKQFFESLEKVPTDLKELAMQEYKNQKIANLQERFNSIARNTQIDREAKRAQLNTLKEQVTRYNALVKDSSLSILEGHILQRLRELPTRRTPRRAPIPARQLFP